MTQLVDMPGSQITATLEVLQKRGVKPAHLEHLRSESSFADQIAEALLSLNARADVSMKVADDLMRSRYFGPEQWKRFFKISRLCGIPPFPWDAQILESPCPFSPRRVFGKRPQICETHFAFLGLNLVSGQPLTISQMLELLKCSAYRRIEIPIVERWWSKHKFVTETTPQFRWYLMPIKTPHINCLSPHEDYDYQPAVIEVLKSVLYYTRTGKFAAGEVVCCDQTDEYKMVSVGYGNIPTWLSVTFSNTSYAYSGGPFQSVSRKLPPQ